MAGNLSRYCWDAAFIGAGWDASTLVVVRLQGEEAGKELVRRELGCHSYAALPARAGNTPFGMVRVRILSES